MRGARPVYDREEIRALTNRKLSTGAIAKKLGAHEKTIHSIQVSLGLKHGESHNANGPAIGYDRNEPRQWRQLKPWPKGIRFEDAQVPPERFLGKVSANLEGSAGSSAAMVVDGTGASPTRRQHGRVIA